MQAIYKKIAFWVLESKQGFSRQTGLLPWSTSTFLMARTKHAIKFCYSVSVFLVDQAHISAVQQKQQQQHSLTSELE